MSKKKELHFHGDTSLLEKEVGNYIYLAIVGSRNIISYTENILIEFFEEISQFKNIVIVSGGMYGVDLFSHNLALLHGLGTISFLPCGIGSYKKSSLFSSLKIKPDSKYLLISKYPEFYESRKHTFLERNRQLINFSDVTLVAQSGIRSGSIFSGNYSLSIGKKTYCIPISLTNPQFLGNNLLISKGASIFLNSVEFIRDLGFKTSHNLDKDNLFRLLPLDFKNLSSKLVDINPDLLEKTLLELILKGEIFMKDGLFYKK